MDSTMDNCEPGTTSTGTLTDQSSNSGNARTSRNLAEKHRRDNLNAHITQMSNLVPFITGSSRRQDKISVLRLTGAYIRTFFTIGPSTQGFLPNECGDIDLEEYFIDMNDASGGFMLVVTTTGNIVYISPRVEKSLGYSPNEILGKSLYAYVHPDDHKELTKGLTPDESYSSIVERTDIDQSSNSSNDSTNLCIGKPFIEKRCSFNIKIAQRTNSRSEHTQFKCFNVSGVLRLANYRKNNPTKNRNSTSNDIIFAGVARILQRRINELSLLEANKQEYVTRHLIDGRIIFSDHRIGIVAGYMTEEVSGVNAFSFMHKDDVRYTIMALRQLYERREGFGSSCYRLLSKTGAFIYLKTHGYLEFDQKNGTFSSFVCINTLIDSEEGEKLIKDLRARFSATKIVVETDVSHAAMTSNPSVEDPTQLEDVISNLISVITPSPASEKQDSALDVANVTSECEENLALPAPSDSTNKQIKDESPDLNLQCTDTYGTADEFLQTNTVDEIEYDKNYLTNADMIVDNNQPTNHDHSNILLNTEQSVTTGCIQNYVSYSENNKYDTSFEMMNNVQLETQDCQSNVVNSLNYNDNDRCENRDRKLILVNDDVMDIKTTKQSVKRLYVDDDDKDCDVLTKKQRKDVYENNSPSKNYQNMIKVKSEVYRMLNELDQVMNSENDGNIHTLTTDQVDQKLRQTYSHLEDRINCQEHQINELELVFESPNFQAQRENFDQIQAEHEVQKKIIKTLQQKQYSIKAKQDVRE